MHIPISSSPIIIRVKSSIQAMNTIIEFLTDNDTEYAINITHFVDSSCWDVVCIDGGIVELRVIVKQGGK